MRLRKFAHAFVRLDDGDRSLVIDPGIFSGAAETADALDGVGALLITHEHPDHVDDAAVHAALAADSSLHGWAPAVVGSSAGSSAGSGWTSNTWGRLPARRSEVAGSRCRPVPCPRPGHEAHAAFDAVFAGVGIAI